MIATRFALEGSIEFTQNHSFEMKCSNILPGRLFSAGSDAGGGDNLTELLRKDVLYMVDGRRRGQRQSLPLADLFFVTEKKQIVLISITGDSDVVRRVNKRQRNLEKWIQQQQQSHDDDDDSGFTVHGVQLAPFDDAHHHVSRSVCINADLRGVDAMYLLGGLGQVAGWLNY